MKWTTEGHIHSIEGHPKIGLRWHFQQGCYVDLQGRVLARDFGTAKAKCEERAKAADNTAGRMAL